MRHEQSTYIDGRGDGRTTLMKTVQDLVGASPHEGEASEVRKTRSMGNLSKSVFAVV